jgi:kynurenine formamidase
MKLIDLSHLFDPVAHAAKPDKKMELAIKTTKTVHDHGVGTLEITFGNHLGTHVDAPAHLIEGGKTVDQLPLEAFYGSAVVLDIPKGDNGGVSAADLEAASPRVGKGDIVVICCGWGNKEAAHNYASHHPYITEDGAEWLVAKGVHMVGMDVQSVDLPHSLRKPGFAYTSLRILLKNGVPAIHNMTNLEAIAGRRVNLLALPINFKGADGSPCRVVAQVD